ncbi:hypothetical protein MJO29_008457 [Puccinia striiformis f. sp. tritici]|uniref:hypothetical protein n=1 Tax=Puccinia striiformis f. sp. tritici TaxID=168172 RepID=UPI002008841D|nr:hypothetical protein Pst134EA_015359 [Puccinia striiformis f. sp. tritici]KAH9463274.1 hypothetical protein Pst134EA_015359 [Puccinia striiformis f. sp. tritici]KAI7952826.1 hypothetical protein MJO29_008457 [Puccinia striiformis f. sp. tritici]
MHVDGAEAGPWSDRYFSDHVLPDRAPGMQDSQTLRRTQTGLGLGGSVEGIQGRLTEEKELQFLREQLTTYIEAIRPKNPKSKLFQKKIDTNEPMESASDLLQYAEQLQVIHKSIPTSPKDRLLLKWTDNPVMFDGREPPSPPAPTRESTLEKFKTMDTLVERMMGTLSIKIPSFKGIGSRTRAAKADPLQEVSEVPKSSSRSPLAERIAPISPMAGTLFGDPLNIVMNMAAQDRLRSLHDLLDKIMPLEKARKRTGPDDQYYASLVLQLFVFRTVQFMYEHELISSDHLKSFFAMKDTASLATINVYRSCTASRRSLFRYSELRLLGFCYSNDFADFVDEGVQHSFLVRSRLTQETTAANILFFLLESLTKSGTAIEMIIPKDDLERFQRAALLLASCDP